MEMNIYCYENLFRKIFAPSIILLCSVCSAETKLDEIVQLMKQRESAIQSIKYEMTQTKYRTKEGSSVLEQMRPGIIMKMDNPEARARQDFIRIRQGEKDFVSAIIYNEDCITANTKNFLAWDGSIGKRYTPQANFGRVERKHFTVDEELAEKAGLELEEKPLYAWFSDPQKSSIVNETPNEVIVEVKIQPYVTARYLLDKEKNFSPKSYEILKGGQKAYELV